MDDKNIFEKEAEIEKVKTIGEKLTKESSIYFNPNPIFCWQRLLYFIIGTRGVGKTYGFVKRSIKRYIKAYKKGKKNKPQFMYLRRADVELDSVDTLFNPFIVQEVFKGWEFKVVGDDFFIKPEESETWDLLGCAMALSKSHQFKGSSYPNIEIIIYDEFMAEVGQRELKKEVNKLFNLIETVFRFRTPCVVLLGNATTFENTQYKYELNLQAPYNSSKWFHPTRPIAVHLVKNEEYIKKKKESKFGKLVAGTSYEDGMIDNKFYADSNSFIKKKKGTYRFLFSFYYKGEIFGCFTNGKNVIIDKSKVKPDFQILDPEMDKQTRIMKKNHPIIKKLSKYAELGCLFYQNAEVKAKLHKLFLTIIFN